MLNCSRLGDILRVLIVCRKGVFRVCRLRLTVRVEISITTKLLKVAKTFIGSSVRVSVRLVTQLSVFRCSCFVVCCSNFDSVIVWVNLGLCS